MELPSPIFAGARTRNHHFFIRIAQHYQQIDSLAQEPFQYSLVYLHHHQVLRATRSIVMYPEDIFWAVVYGGLPG